MMVVNDEYIDCLRSADVAVVVGLPDLAVMSLPDDQEAGSRPGGGDDDPLVPPSGLRWPYHFPVPHPYGSAPPLQQLLAEGGGVSEGT